MIPIFEQGDGKGIGLTLDAFIERLEELCELHLSEGRAKAFAFVFYNVKDRSLRQILRDRGVFAQMDRLCGRGLSLFYLHSGGERTIKRFNHEFLSRLGLESGISLPCVVFFRMDQGSCTDISVAQLDSADLVHGFHELYGIVEKYPIDGPNALVRGCQALKWLRSGAKFVSVEAVRAALQQLLRGIVRH